jgi:hypothetical protein
VILSIVVVMLDAGATGVPRLVRTPVRRGSAKLLLKDDLAAVAAGSE